MTYREKINPENHLALYMINKREMYSMFLYNSRL